MSKERSLPLFLTDDEVEAASGLADLNSYDRSAPQAGAVRLSSEDARLKMRLPVELPDPIKVTARPKAMPYDRLMRPASEEALTG